MRLKFWTGCGVLLVASCQGALDSELDQVSNKAFACHQYEASFVDEKLQQADSFIYGFSGRELQVLRNDLAGIPKSHIDFLIEANKKRNFGIHSASSLGGAAGVTRSEGRSDGRMAMIWYPTRIDLLHDATQIRYAAQHEFGHAIENLFSSHFKDQSFQSEYLMNLAMESSKHKNNPRLNSYPKSYLRHGNGESIYVKEFWAEVYSSYYCSAEAQDYLKDQTSPQNSFISTYEWISGFLDPAAWDKGTKQDSPSSLDLAVWTQGNVFMVSIPQENRYVEHCEWDERESRVFPRTCQRMTKATAENTTRSFYFFEGFTASTAQRQIVVRLDKSDYLVGLKPKI